MGQLGPRDLGRGCRHAPQRAQHALRQHPDAQTEGQEREDDGHDQVARQLVEGDRHETRRDRDEVRGPERAAAADGHERAQLGVHAHPVRARTDRRPHPALLDERLQRGVRHLGDDPLVTLDGEAVAHRSDAVWPEPGLPDDEYQVAGIARQAARGLSQQRAAVDQLGERQLSALVHAGCQRPLGEQVHGHRHRAQDEGDEDPEHQGQLQSQSQPTVTPRANLNRLTNSSRVSVLGVAAHSSRSTYPTPRTVWMRRLSPSPSSFRLK